MSDVERRLRELGEKARHDVTKDLVPEPAALRRIRFRRRAVSAAAGLTAVMVVLGGVVVAGGRSEDRRDTPPAKEGAVTPAPERDKTSAVCDFAFEPTYLPEGFDAQARAGSAGGGGGVGADVMRRHYSGPRGRAIEIAVEPLGAFAQTRRTRMYVLGRRATLGAIHEGHSVGFRLERCPYEILGYGITRAELRRFAEGLREPGVERDFAALWPEDTFEAAREACAVGGRYRRSGWGVVRRFSRKVLSWAPGTGSGNLPGGTRSTWAINREGDGKPDVHVFLKEVFPRCWSVESVSPFPDRRAPSVGISVSGRSVDVAFDPRGATTATIEVGYGGRVESVAWDGGEGIVHLDLPFDPDTTGHFLILYRDVTGEVFSASGGPLPPGDFSAG